MNDRGRKLTAKTALRRTVNATSMGFSVLRAYGTVLWLKEVADNGDAASSAHTVLTAVVYLGKILTGLAN
ncbi:hypothetical protein [Nocardia asteroides]|uniref:hypothetical protein n=1 Tax=Nocardia asteroides TaxID=1824 RepID=UPI00365D9309